MSHPQRSLGYHVAVSSLTGVFWLATLGVASAEQQVRFKNGLGISGGVADIASLNQHAFSAAGGGVKSRPIMVIDDQLRRVYVHEKGMVAAPPVDIPGVETFFEFRHDVPLDGKAVQGIGTILGVSPFNAFGRRAVNVRGPDGAPLTIFQGITELNTRYARVQSLKGTPSYVWDMRVATSSLDSATLRTMFQRRLDYDDLDRRLEVVRFFIEARRFADAHDEFKEVLAKFPQAKQMRPMLIKITEMQASQLLDEAKQRAEVGQEEFARSIYKAFPLQAVSRITRLQVQDEVQKLDDTRDKGADLIAKLRKQLTQIDAGKAAAIKPLVDEMEAGLSSATLPRLNDYLLNADAKAMALDNRIALAVSGWLLGPGSGEQNLTVAIALIQVRDLVAEYLNTDDPGRRAAILLQLQNLEGAEPEYVSRMLPLLKPTRAWPADSEAAPGMHRVVGDAGDNPIRVVPQYVIQLPPEYDPLREYPCIVALHTPFGTPEQQLDWWAGPLDAETGQRGGHAIRNGYIVVAPLWTRPQQRNYEYTPREHQRVLVSLRDAMRRASIDSDRIFLTGHGDGATAAWDIALSHPDMWAGMISISGEPKKTIRHYSDNAKYLPIYLVMGELDGAPAPLVRNGPVLDGYMKIRNDAMVVMYRGRGREFFYDEIHRMFEWMNLPLHVRRGMPQKIETSMMREGDTYFWWLELGPLKPGTAIDPILWNQAERIRGKIVEANVGNDNIIRVSQGPTDQFHVWLRPGMGIDMGQRVTVRYRSRSKNLDFDGSLTTLLEDTRQRADRKRPFWATISIP